MKCNYFMKPHTGMQHCTGCWEALAAAEHFFIELHFVWTGRLVSSLRENQDHSSVIWSGIRSCPPKNPNFSVTCWKKCRSRRGTWPTSPLRPSCPTSTSVSWHCFALSSLWRFPWTCLRTSTLSGGIAKRQQGYQQSSMITVNTVSTIIKSLTR